MEQGSRGIKFAALVLQKLHTLHSSLGHFYANSTFCGKSHHTARGSQLQAALSTQRSTLTSRLYHAPSSLITQKKAFFSVALLFRAIRYSCQSPSSHITTNPPWHQSLRLKNHPEQEQKPDSSYPLPDPERWQRKGRLGKRHAMVRTRVLHSHAEQLEKIPPSQTPV